LFHTPALSLYQPTASLDEKIRKLDEQLAQHKQKIKTTRGPAQEAAKRRALVVSRLLRPSAG